VIETGIGLIELSAILYSPNIIPDVLIAAAHISCANEVFTVMRMNIMMDNRIFFFIVRN
jgi:hypothetical protein